MLPGYPAFARRIHSSEDTFRREFEPYSQESSQPLYFNHRTGRVKSRTKRIVLMILIFLAGSSPVLIRDTPRDLSADGPISFLDQRLLPPTGSDEDVLADLVPPPGNVISSHLDSQAHFRLEPEQTSSIQPANSPGSSDDLTLPKLEEFRRSVRNGHSDQLLGIWVEDVLAFRVSPGTHSNAPSTRNTAAVYSWADEHGVTALLIHNYLGGTRLYRLNPGVKIAAIYGDGGVDWYVVRNGTWYETRNYSHSGFRGPFRIWSCGECDFDLSVQDIRQRHYSGTPHLAFQTCVETTDRAGLLIIDAYFLSHDAPSHPVERRFLKTDSTYPRDL